MTIPGDEASPVRKQREPIEGRLRELRRSIRSSILLRAGSLLAAAAVGAVLLSLAVDRLFRLAIVGRAVAGAVYGAILLWAAWRLLIRPIAARLPDGVLADIFEKRFPLLGDRFRSAVEFLREPAVRAPRPPEAGRAAPMEGTRVEDIGLVLKREVVREARTEIERLEVSDVIDTPGLVSTLTAGVLAVGLLSVLAVVMDDTFGLWWRRNVLFEDIEWPYRTRLVVEGFPYGTLERGVPKGDPLTLRVRAEGEIPARVAVRIAYEHESLRFNLAREGAGDIFVHEHAEVTEPFRFVVEGGDFRSRPHHVRVLERPEVKEIEATLEHPPYTRKPPLVLKGDLGELAVPEGTLVQLDGVATKDLASAWLEIDGRRVDLEVSRAPGGPEGEGARRFRGELVPEKGGIATIHLADLEGVPPNQFFRFLVTPVPDRPPVVLARAEGVGSMITPSARIPLKVRATDDHGVVELGLEYDAATLAAPGTHEPARGTIALPAPADPGPRVEEDPAWEIGPLKIEPETRLDVRVFAMDNDGIHGSKKGHAATQSFLVVTPERLGEEFLRREEEQRRLLERIVAEERAVRDAVYRLIDEAWKAEAPLREEVLKEMVGLARTERGLARQVSGIAGAMRLLRDEMRNNRVGELEEAERLVNAVIDPLDDAAERLLPALAAQVGAVREMPRPGDRVREGLVLAGNVEDLIRRLEAVLASMKRLEGFTEVVNRLRSIIKVHDESVEAAKKSYRRELDSIFEDDPGKPGTTTGSPGGVPAPPRER